MCRDGCGNVAAKCDANCVTYFCRTFHVIARWLTNIVQWVVGVTTGSDIIFWVAPKFVKICAIIGAV